MSVRIHHDLVAEITEEAEARGETIVDWVHRLQAARGESGPVGWRVLPCGCLIVEPLEEAIANFATQESTHA